MATVFQVKKVNLADMTESETTAIDGGFFVSSNSTKAGDRSLFTADRATFF
jgi:hypothetical protein